MSPGFPMEYDNNLQCNYTIQFPNRYINLEFISFDLEGLYCWTCAYISILTHWCQNLMSIVICRRPDFKFGLHMSRHNYIVVSILCIAYNTHNIWYLRVNLPLESTCKAVILLGLFSAIQVQNIMDQRVALLLHIWMVPGSDLSLNTNYPV